MTYPLLSTYPILSAAFLALAAAVLVAGLVRAPDRARLLARWTVPASVTGVVLVVLTAVFDNLMIAAGLMTYAAAAISGAHLGLVPVEDLAYPIAGLMLLPGLWLLLRPRRQESTGARGSAADARTHDRSSR
ncbi:lycopene cyclase domain-containing protein [Leifsonia sp. NPDC056824]|uniref:lycopene cyclase domain-containing protein n=1 Tax=Leifsonia sp. NPDC056824 TaxID=3345953 RepID=UPI0036825CFD